MIADYHNRDWLGWQLGGSAAWWIRRKARKDNNLHTRPPANGVIQRTEIGLSARGLECSMSKKIRPRSTDLKPRRLRAVGLVTRRVLRCFEQARYGARNHEVQPRARLPDGAI